VGPAPGALADRGHGASTRAIAVHRSRTLTEADRTGQDDGLALTTVTRTLVDLADVLTPHRLERVLHRAQHLRLLDAAALERRLAELPGRRAHALRAALATLAHAGPDLTRSELEERFLALVATGRLPRPELNVRLGPFEVDALWRAQRLVAELDGAAAHLTPRAFDADRRRDADLQVRGLRVVRFTWRQVVHEPRAVAGTLRALLRAG
jgi:very-short-patch-repair endonuclease